MASECVLGRFVSRQDMKSALCMILHLKGPRMARHMAWASILPPKAINLQSEELRNGNMIVRTSGWGGNPGGYRLASYRYSWNGLGSEFNAEFSFSTTPKEQIYGTGTQ
ncbi:uncharacterized protein N7477_002096 [Penicillium maclennaniae]|uniref:uncharacterized protein n=1 Tax=Penicillium maclennaniae TaxID=1343394 RepID=UPI00254055A4|nr:uncharacterized protein N7477_002096 [Penicillium maclennaniae]KAJ5676463.1 hypothetical protein N7477_002096 [Penicillium maclennaniae]